MIITPGPRPTALRQAIREAYHMDETRMVDQLTAEAATEPAQQEAVAREAARLVNHVRDNRVSQGGVDALLHEYDLSSKEGVVLMCLAEALMRVPDSATADRLIQDKISTGDWESHLGHSESIFVNASTWGLMLTGRVVRFDERSTRDLAYTVRRMVQRSGEPVIRQAIRQAMRIMGRQFVIGRTIDEAIKRAREDEKQGYRHSYDMLGEAARTMDDADRYYASYQNAIKAIARAGKGRGVLDGPGISVKLSALHPRYELGQFHRSRDILVERLGHLAELARDADIGLCVDAEEADRLDISLDVIEAVSGDASLSGWDGFGLAVQAYQKRAAPLIDWLADLARRHDRRLMVRLVKGAYWDSEVKRAQEGGHPEYPVFTRKVSTDVSYLACARRLLRAGAECIYPQFATHNAHTLAWVMQEAGDAPYEFQRLHGMGEALYEPIVGRGRGHRPVRIYAPVGSHEELLPYLVRRLLENGANSSFVNRIQDEKLPVEEMVADPVEAVQGLKNKPHPRIPLPAHIYGEQRRNSKGVNLADHLSIEPLGQAMDEAARGPWHAAPVIGGRPRPGQAEPVRNPARTDERVGEVTWATPEQADEAVAMAHRAAPGWAATPVEERAQCLERVAGLMERHMAELMALCVREAGKGIPDAVAEVREAVDFCRYYAQRARLDFGAPMPLPGPTGERNEIALHGRGVFVCISPWNFPLAIFTGQVTAALVAGNTVVAKPAEQTSLIGARAAELLHEAGVPPEALQLLPGAGEIGGRLVADERIGGVAFTGSVATARRINQTLSQRQGPIIPLIAETGGQNAMIADSTALPEQLVRDVLISSFQSAGQRCSALRVLYVQEDVADHVLEMLAGAMQELTVGDPAWLATDVGPVIDAEARDNLMAHVETMRRQAPVIGEAPLPPETREGTFVPPIAFEINGIDDLEAEHFGPVLHVVRYNGRELDQVIDAINNTGYGLTMGLHSRIDAVAERVAQRARVGNLYVNRNQIGAVVGVQPFGGEGLSGTGPKAGGPRYLHRFATERTVTVDTTAAGGNASLFAMGDEEDLPR
ncbi:bifunctional proline dehydrogenase/L-glutamate gamma-semialdehyde dehydrogenase PutA [Aquisalimonas lutea]|uniref:bifunctional proline dehydrogenase/L-glutamate gamma-semialdehyde dehydrogenase PutA n=1 Tax=Aquisalimonas lutea TaxID=1327750 RepID=UPI0025B2CEE8|nr:bifunctional proline dehydrogenase/L-glutamate gamma-semialdehyde dehydrogenase PutA [Aquisalimonas lutea]MDN3516984.1 bifunctional proline dehydrogenase/L-glutamate gamma-semialdehyde dehydrogenase PutA [Aquisalimonas lutea]